MIWTGTACGRGLNLLNPDPADVSLRNHIAPTLSRINRFNGSTTWSVAEHCLVGAQAILEETKSPRLALLFMLHDAHEAYIGDLPKPAVAALTQMVEMAARVSGAPDAVESLGKPLLTAALDALKTQIDHAIHTALGVPIATDRERVVVHDMDARMCGAEMRQLMPPQAKPHDPRGPYFARPVRTRGGLKPRRAASAAVEYAVLTESLIDQTARSAA
jgi:hypothetical protein